MNRIMNLIDEFLKNEKGGLNPLGKSIKIVLIFVVIKIVSGLINKIIDKALNNKKRNHLLVNERRANTLINTLKKIINYTLLFIGIMTTLDMFGVNTTSILATAGVGGLAIGFGAQSLVKDLITGFFILLEDQYSVGDYIEIGQYDGIVEELGLRVTKIRAFSGELHIIPNSNIQTVTNKTRGAMRALVTISVGYEEDIDKVTTVLQKACDRIKASNDSIVEGPTVIGVTDLGEYKVDINIVAKTKPMEQWAVERQIRKELKEALVNSNIEIPYPKRVIVGGDNSDSKL